jgi:hypothetical protein
MRGKLIAPLVSLAGTALSAYFAAPVPVLAGGAMMTAGKDTNDERFRYLTNPTAEAGFEAMIGNAWFFDQQHLPFHDQHRTR